MWNEVADILIAVDELIMTNWLCARQDRMRGDVVDYLDVCVFRFQKRPPEKRIVRSGRTALQGAR